jgi:hypothetical protein
MESLHRKYNGLASLPRPTGDPRLPEVVKQAKINKQLNMNTSEATVMGAYDLTMEPDDVLTPGTAVELVTETSTELTTALVANMATAYFPPLTLLNNNRSTRHRCGND